MIKKENVQMKRKRIQCNIHGNAIKYHCEWKQCSSPYVCSNDECFEEHFHNEGKMTLTKFDSKLWLSKIQEVQNVINNDSLKIKSEYLTKVVHYFSSSLQQIHEDMNNFDNVKQKICEGNSKGFNCDYFHKINGFLSLGSKIQRRLDQLRAKINDEDIMIDESSVLESHVQNNQQIQSKNQLSKPSDQKCLKDNIQQNNQSQQVNNERSQVESSEAIKLSKKKAQYYENKDLTEFLRIHIDKFEWQLTEVIFSSQSHLTTCQKFHEKLKDKKRLLFLFIGENQIIGSYYDEPYPSVSQKFRKDPKSFIFINDERVVEKFAIFLADAQSQSHMTVTQKLLICQGNTPNNGDGLRTFQKNFESLSYFLPSRSFQSLNDERELIYNGSLKIKQFYILQILSA